MKVVHRHIVPSKYLLKVNHYGFGPCHICKGGNHGYMLHWHLWEQVVSFWEKALGKTDKTDYICMFCSQIALGRKLTENDLLDAPINSIYYKFPLSLGFVFLVQSWEDAKSYWEDAKSYWTL